MEEFAASRGVHHQTVRKAIKDGRLPAENWERRLQPMLVGDTAGPAACAVSGYLRVSTVAEELDVSPRTVLRWVERGDLQAVRLPGGRLRISQTAFDAFVDAGLTTPAGRILAQRKEVRMGEIQGSVPGRSLG